MENDNDGVDTPNDGIGIIDAAAHGHMLNLDVHSTPANDPDQMIGGTQQNQGGALWAGGSGEAQHVTGMMSAAILDDADDLQ